MKLLKKILIIILRLSVVAGIYFGIQYLKYRNFTIKKGIVVASGYFEYTSGRSYTYAHYPIVAFTKPNEDSIWHLNMDSIPQPFDEAHNQIFRVGNLFFTQPPPGWHLNETSRIGDTMSFYYIDGNFENAQVLSTRSYWITESAIYLIMLIVFVWTVAIDLYQIRKKEKKSQVHLEDAD